MAVWQPVTSILFDLDDTLYRNDEVGELMKQNIAGYMREKLGIPADGLEAQNKHFYVDYGTTLAGLRVTGYAIDYEDWHAYVHGRLPYSRLFSRDETLREVLSSLPQPKYVFTNADIRHAETVLGKLGIRDLFQDIICFESVMKAAEAKGLLSSRKPVICKPSTEAFQLALEQAGVEAESTLFLDDSARNIQGATAAGIRTVLVGGKPGTSPALAEIESLAELPRALPELWTQRATVRPEPHLSRRTVAPEVQVVAQ